MKTAIVQFNPKTANIDYNFDKIKSYINDINGCDLIIFPALSITGINCRDYFLSNDFIEKQNKVLDELTILSEKIDIMIGCVEKTTDGLFSSIAFLQNGKKEYICRKKNLSPNEIKYFKSGKGATNIDFKGALVTVSLDNETTCKTDILLNFSLENFQMDTFSKKRNKKDFAEIRINPVCLSGSYLYFGGSYISNKNGEKILELKPFKEHIIIYDNRETYSVIQSEQTNVYDITLDALTFALKDFCYKNGFKKIVLGLSGGIDSAFTAVIACRAIGAENVVGITMPSEYSSSGSVDDSYALAKNLGMQCFTKPIKPLFDCFLENIQDKKHLDLAEENLQSRMRAIILMNYSNRYNALLLTTGNKSEVATGYCTLYGDTCGGFSVLSDIYKTDVYKISERINKDKEIIPISTMTKPPSAELRPNQKDSDSLPDYDLLDKVIKMYFEDKLSIEDIKIHCPSINVEQIIKTILRAEFKRKQMTAGVKLSNRSFVCDIDYPTV